jgi:hypothetical protein
VFFEEGLGVLKLQVPVVPRGMPNFGPLHSTTTVPCAFIRYMTLDMQFSHWSLWDSLVGHHDDTASTSETMGLLLLPICYNAFDSTRPIAHSAP